MKKLLALLLTCAMVLSLGLLAGCGQTDTGEASTDAQTSTEAEGQDTNADTGDLQKIVFTEDVRGYHWAPAYLAQTLGYFKDEGLDAEFQTIKGGDATAPVLSGDAQFCLKGVETSLMVNEGGQGMKILLSTTQKYPYQLIGATSQYSTLESLKGGVVAGGLSVNSGPYTFARACMANAGFTDEDVTITNMASAGYAAAIQAGELQGAVSTNPWSAKKLTDAGGVVIIDGTDGPTIEKIIGSQSYELFTVMTSDDLIAQNPELVQKAVNAMTKAIQWMQTASAEEIAQNLLPLFDGAEEELQYDAAYDKEHHVYTTDGYHTESGYNAALTLTKLAGGITKDLPVDQTYDESFLANAWETLNK